MSLPIRIWLGPLLRWLRSLSRSMRVHLVSTRPAPYPSAETERQARDPVLRAAGDWPVHRYEHRRHHRALAVLRPRSRPQWDHGPDPGRSVPGVRWHLGRSSARVVGRRSLLARGSHSLIRPDPLAPGPLGAVARLAIRRTYTP